MKYAPSAYQGAILMICKPSVDRQKAQLIKALAELAAMSAFLPKYHSGRSKYKYINLCNSVSLEGINRNMAAQVNERQH